jgi:hypothetical protein
MKESIISSLKRIGYALPFAIFCGYSVHKALDAGGSLGSLAWFLYAAAALITVAAIFAFPIADFIGERLGRFYLPGGSDVPPPHYLLAERYEQETKWDLALAEFEKIIHYHPTELLAHVGRIRLALIGYEDDAMARRIFKRSLRTLRNPDAIALLQESWENLQTQNRNDSL